MRVNNMLPPCCVYPQGDEHPTQSRFWTFREAICRMLAMHVLGFPSNALRLRSVRPRKENKTRMAKVLGFFADTSSPQALRQACLCLQLTGAALSFTAWKDKDDPNVAPLSARLSQGAAHTLVRDTLVHPRAFAHGPRPRCGCGLWVFVLHSLRPPVAFRP